MKRYEVVHWTFPQPSEICSDQNVNDKNSDFLLKLFPALPQTSGFEVWQKNIEPVLTVMTKSAGEVGEGGLTGAA